MSVKQMKNGFYPALGTPVDDNGKLNEKSYARGIDLMIESGAAGVLCMGSMGNMVSMINSEYPKIASACVRAVAKRVPVMVGVMDLSIKRVLERIDALNNLEIDGVVATPPFYYKPTAGEIVNFFTAIAKNTKYPVYVYDLPPVTQSPVSQGMIAPLMKISNIKGIKTANMNMILDLIRNNAVREDFEIFYSGLDTFDAAIKSGIKKNLDGMFTCTPYNSKMMYEDFEKDGAKVATHLNNILRLRNIMAKEEIFPAYSYAMELIGCPGNYHPDFDKMVSDKLREEIKSFMKEIREI